MPKRDQGMPLESLRCILGLLKCSENTNRIQIDLNVLNVHRFGLLTQHLPRASSVTTLGRLSVPFSTATFLSSTHHFSTSHHVY